MILNNVIMLEFIYISIYHNPYQALPYSCINVDIINRNFVCNFIN